MSRKSAPWIGLGLALLIAAFAACFWYSNRAQESERDIQYLKAKQAELSGEIASLKTRLAEAESRAQPIASTPSIVQTSTRKQENPAMQLWRRKFSPYQHRNMVRIMWYRFHDVFAKFNLPPEMQVKLADLVTSKWEAGVDARDAANNEGIADPKEVEAAAKVAEADVESEIVGLIGPANEQALLHGEELQGQINFLERGIGTEMQMGGAPLSADQESSMAEIYLDQQKQGQPVEPNGSVNIQLMQQNDASTLDKANKVLGPEQMSILRNYLSWNEEKAKVFEEQPK